MHARQKLRIEIGGIASPRRAPTTGTQRAGNGEMLRTPGPRALFKNNNLDNTPASHSAILAAVNEVDITGMNRGQRIASIVAAVNLLLIVLFPPIDQYSIASAAVPVFAGFHFVFSKPPLGQINPDLLAIEVLVILVNLAIAWLLLRNPAGTAAKPRRFGLQNAALLFTGANLVLMLLFPPMESVFALTKAAVPTFEGFYFIFSLKPAHVIVGTLLYLEIVFILANGALLWLIFRERQTPAGDEFRAAMRQFTQR
ncbi:MAG: hypothetical protein KIT13_07830 [Burkholderiales bacterium]|nr:hypothetical protein [Burkholderiales bacterium]